MNQYFNQKATTSNGSSRCNCGRWCCCCCCCLLLVTAAGATTTSTLELASLRANIWASVRVGHTRSFAEVLEGSTGGTSTLEQQGVLASGRTQGQLIQSQHLTAGLQDALASRLGDMQGAQRQLGDHQQTGVIGNGTNNHNGRLWLVGCLEEASDALQRHWWPVYSAHEQTFQDDTVELLVGTTLQETVQL